MKILYSLPAVLICIIYGFILFILEGTFDAAIDMVQSVVLLYIVLPIIGSALLMKNKWWGCFSGIAMGILLIYNNLKYTGHQHVNIDIPLGIVFNIYYSAMGFLCYRLHKKPTPHS